MSLLSGRPLLLELNLPRVALWRVNGAHPVTKPAVANDGQGNQNSNM